MVDGIREQSGLAQRLHMDVPLLLGLLALATVGLVVMYSVDGGDGRLMTRHAMRLLIAFAVMFVLAQINPRHLFHWTPWLYLLGLILLIAVLVFGDVGKGAQRWLRIGPLNFQPSELSKLTVPLMVAYFFTDKSLPPRVLPVLGAVGLALLPTFLVIRQPDLGTALLIGCSGAFVMFLTGLRWSVIAVFAGLLAASAPLLWFTMHDYQRSRVLTFLNPEQDPLGAGYHIIQSKIAIGSGGIYGKGWLNGTQSQLDFVPERSTDFVFAVFGEEFGLMGAMVLIALYLFVIFRGLYIAVSAQELFGRLIAGGLVLTFFVYVFVNIGMVSGLLPVVGLPLPLVSYGGTALVTVMASFGIVMSVHTHRRLLSD
jgi:rod shape determining protein RodA